MKVVFVGVPGAGKSSLIKYAEENDHRSDFAFLHEPVEEWLKRQNGSLFHNFCQDREKYTYAFQMKVLQDMLERDRCVRQARYRRTFVCERDAHSGVEVFCQVAIDNGYLLKETKSILMDFCRLQGFPHLFPDVYVYVKASCELALERIRKRNRPGEVELYSENNAFYLKQLYDRHEFLFARKVTEWNVPVIVLDGANSKEKSWSEFKKKLRTVSSNH